ncbi:hypothetical protein Sta7437_2839 [Stanieria cyanosphaera PCC 7437]|uniref:Uncharacterized protein n=1 Tax=Stanieria cyanosphaera (strain ATCC 29371 / PCC 7437) TaxID=111780 RepID=K9XUT0_STAC7|nr:hypothetical protein [Stanieria cyanosphaera]AFZ36360.1 hypothetical protein Sta7437_2839 [Stanieria cyanosphaera PCC 7437]
MLNNEQLSDTPGIKIPIKLNIFIDNIFGYTNYNDREKKIVQTIVDKFQSSINRDIKIKQSNLNELSRH